MRTGLGDFSPIAGQTAKLSGRHTEEQIRQSFIELGDSYRCLALFTPVLKGFSSNSQARGKDSPCPRKGQIPSPEKAPKKRPRGARLITAQRVSFYAGKAIISLWPTKSYQEIESNGSNKRRERTEGKLQVNQTSSTEAKSRFPLRKTRNFPWIRCSLVGAKSSPTIFSLFK